MNEEDIGLVCVNVVEEMDKLVVKSIVQECLNIFKYVGYRTEKMGEIARYVNCDYYNCISYLTIFLDGTPFELIITQLHNKVNIYEIDLIFHEHTENNISMFWNIADDMKTNIERLKNDFLTQVINNL